MFLPLVLIMTGPVCLIVMMNTGKKDEQQAAARTEWGLETHKYYAAEYSRRYRWCKAISLFYLCCLILPVFPAIFIEIFEISFVKAWQVYLAFAVLGLAAERWLLKNGDENIEYVMVGNGGLKVVHRDGNEKIYSLTRFERYEKRRSRSGISKVLIFRGDEKNEFLYLDELGEESADRIYRDIQVIRQYGYFPQQQSAQQMKDHGQAFQQVQNLGRSHQQIQKPGQSFQQVQDRRRLQNPGTVQNAGQMTQTGLSKQSGLPKDPYSKEAQKAAIAETTKKQAAIRSNPAEFEIYLKKTAQKLRAEEKKNALDLIHSGRKVEAIKFVREVTGIGLADAKEIVDHYETMLDWVTE